LIKILLLLPIAECALTVITPNQVLVQPVFTEIKTIVTENRKGAGFPAPILYVVFKKNQKVESESIAKSKSLNSVTTLTASP
jgi:hypothetical protein